MRFFPLVAALALLAGCGEAGLEITEPDPVGNEPEDFTLHGGVVDTLDAGLCKSCHYGNNPTSNFRVDLEGEALWQEMMDGGTREADGYGEVVNLDDPPQSLLLLAPLAESSFAHTPKPFTSELDAGYLTILRWIENGAPND